MLERSRSQCKKTCLKKNFRLFSQNKKMKFESEQYTAVKKVYDTASQSMGDMIVFKKK